MGKAALTRSTALATLVLTAAVLLLITPFLARPALALGEVNGVANPGFEDTTSKMWTLGATSGDGTVIVYDNANPHLGKYSAMLNATRTTATCPPSTECKDSVRAGVDQSIPLSNPSMDSVANAPDSFSAWWFVENPRTDGMKDTYSLHIGLGLTDGSSIEYWYGESDLSNQRYNLGPIPQIGSWFRMTRNLRLDLQPLNVPSPSTTRIYYVWFSAFGNITRGERAWVDDVAITFTPHPVALFSTAPASGSAPLTVTFNASQSYETAGFATKITDYRWNFGDGTSLAHGGTVSHTYNLQGAFQVVLTVVDDYNNTSSQTSTVRVTGYADLSFWAAGLAGMVVVGVVFFVRRRRHRSKQVKAKKPKFRRG